MNSYRVEYPSWDTAHEYGYVVDDKGREWIHSAAYRGAYKQKPNGRIYSWSGSKWERQNEFGGDDDD